MTVTPSVRASGEMLPSPAPSRTGREPATGPDPESEPETGFRHALASLGREIDRGEKMLGRALGAARGGMAAGDLIALQAGIYRYSETVDLAAKLVDRAGNAVRTTLQGSG